MAKLNLKGMIASAFVGPDKFNGEIRKDEKGVDKVKRVFDVLDLEAEQTTVFKIKFTADQEEQINKLMRKTCMIVADVGTYNKFNFYNLISIQAIN
jgi:hypothetical protein